MSLTKHDFVYQLPDELIAQSPAQPRDHSRLLVFDRQTGRVINSETYFYDLPRLLNDFVAKTGRQILLVRNNSAVIPARLFGQKPETQGQIEVLLVKNLSRNTRSETWACLTKPGLKIGQRIIFPNSKLTAFCEQINGYTRTIKFVIPNEKNSDQKSFFDHLDQIGLTPLPPYIHSDKTENELRHLYQTIYAKTAGSVAAPTAGLHFTPNVEKQLIEFELPITEVTLHVGLGTFLTVKEEGDLTNHQMHAEEYSLSSETAQQINAAKARGDLILAVGTTTARVLESALDSNGLLQPTSAAATQIFLYPPYKFKIVDALLTNFHLPESTLLMLISALTSQPNTNHLFTDFIHSPIGQAYQIAIDQCFRFFSFGDSMLII